MGAVAAHKQVEALLDPHQFLTQRGHDGAHGIAVRPGQARALGIDHGRIGHGFVQFVQGLEAEHFRRGALSLGDVKQQAGDEPVGSGLIDRFDALGLKPLQRFVGFSEQAAQRRAVGDFALEHAFDQRRGDCPQRIEGRAPAQGFQLRKDLGQLRQLTRHVVFTQQPQQRTLQVLTQGRHPLGHVLHRQLRQRLGRQRLQHLQGRAEQAGLRKQGLAPGGAQVVD